MEHGWKIKHNVWRMLFLALVFAALCGPVRAKADPTPTPTPGTRLMTIYASYNGGTLKVGDTISRDNITVTAWYMDGTTAEVKDYVLSVDQVTAVGSNRITVVYQGCVSSFYVYGKKPTQLYAQYYGGQVSVGNAIGKPNVNVRIVYSDGSVEPTEDFTLSNHIVNAVGIHKAYVNCAGMVAEFSVYGVAQKPILNLFASYTGGPVYQGNAVSESDLIVTAVYLDNTTEVIYNYTLAPQTVLELGENKITVSFRGVSTTFTVEGLVKTLSSIQAEYRGGSVEVGAYVDPADVLVVAVFNDDSKEVVRDFTLLGARITAVGSNTVTASYLGMRADITVPGVEKTSLNYSYAASFTVKNEAKQQARVQIPLPRSLSTDALVGKSLKASRVSKLMAKIGAQDAKYIAFDLVLTDETMDDIFPLTMRVQIPSSYKMEYTSIYYTPKRKSILGRTDAEVVSERELELTLYRPGTYIICYQEPPKEAEEDPSGGASDDYLE